MMKELYYQVRDNKANWVSGITCYQFRDRGRLGLELEDPNCSSNGIKLLMFDCVRKLIHDPYFQPSMEAGALTEIPVKLRMGRLRGCRRACHTCQAREAAGLL
jgi:hypothetical protein